VAAMHEGDRSPNRTDYEAPPSRQWIDKPSASSPLLHSQRAKGHRRFWRAVLYVGTAICLSLAYWPRATASSPPASAGASWNVELTSTGAKPVTALVFGREAGVHLVRIPDASATPEERRRVPARLAAGDVYMVSLGWSQLDVHTSSPKGTAPMTFGAQARFVRLFKDTRGTGIRTSWRSSQ
jgi:hypothetical protein